MSRHHSSIAHEANHLVTEINRLTEDEIYQLYGISIEEDGSVKDPTYEHLTFKSVHEWATFSIEQDGVAYHETFGHVDMEDF